MEAVNSVSAPMLIVKEKNYNKYTTIGIGMHEIEQKNITHGEEIRQTAMHAID